jgi:hypothetical protein
MHVSVALYLGSRRLQKRSTLHHNQPKVPEQIAPGKVAWEAGGWAFQLTVQVGHAATVPLCIPDITCSAMLHPASSQPRKALERQA